MSDNKNVCIALAEGCPRQQMDIARLSRYFEANNWQFTKRIDEADLLIVGTCGYSEFVQDSSLNLLEIGLGKRKKGVRTIVIGCLTGMDSGSVLARFDVTPLTRSMLNKLDDIIGAEVKYDQVGDVNVFDDYLANAIDSFERDDRRKSLQKRLHKFKNILLDFHRVGFGQAFERGPVVDSNFYNIRIATGCLSECTYCAIRKAAGTVKSKPSDSILEEFRAGLAAGHKDFRLIAEDVGAYGQDIGTNIAELLRKIFANQEEFILRWDDFGPTWLVRYFDEMLEIIRDNPKRIERMVFPVQSGSDHVLELMKRDYKAAEIQRSLLEIKKTVPGIEIGTHFIVGFPGETGKDFMDTIHFMEAVRPTRATVFYYSDRPGTESMHLPNKVSTITGCIRCWRLKFKVHGLHLGSIKNPNALAKGK